MTFDLTVEVRDRAGKGVARQLRRQGKIPAVLYGESECLLLALDPAPLIKILRSPGGSSALLALDVQGRSPGKKVTVLLRDHQSDPVTGHLLHVDFFEVSMTKAIRVKVQVSVIGSTPVGVKNEGGVLQHHLRELTVECLPSAIPQAIEVDASNLEIGQGIHVRELRVGEGVRLLEEGDHMVISVAAPISEEKLEALLTSGAVSPEEAEAPQLVGKEEEPAAEAGATEPKGERKGAPEAKAERKGAPEPKGERKGEPEPKAEKKEAKEEKKK